jgi:hypothetical protein
MSIDSPDHSSRPGAGRARFAGPRPERSYWSLIPGRNLRRALFLILALVAVLSLKQSSGGFFNRVLESITPRAPSVPTTVHIRPRPADR